MESDPKAQSSDVDYQLHTLGWKSFQCLCSTIASELLGMCSQVFLPSHDGGRDGAFYGDSEKAGLGVGGSYVVQCKFSSSPGKNVTLASLSEEIDKARGLAQRGLATNYILMTNMGLSGTTDEAVRKAFLAVAGIKWFAAYGSDWICLRIRENERLRMLVPRVYGLGDLSQILDVRGYSQAQAILASMGDDLAKFVITDAHRRSAKALLEHGFVLLLGEPASGKSIIGATLAMGAIDVWKCSTMKILHPDSLVGHWNPHEPHQFFWVDDAFGSTQYQRDLALAWSAVFPHVQAAIRRGARVLFTSRDYVFESAMRDIKVSAFPLIRESQVIVRVQELSLEEKEQILYNHIKLGDQPKAFRTRVKPFLPSVAASQRFLPEVARRLGTSAFTNRLALDHKSIMDFAERPVTFLQDVVRSLDADSKAALSLLFMRGGMADAPVELSDAERRGIERLGSSVGGLARALTAMDGSLVLLVRTPRMCWRFKHPTIADAVADLTSQDPELVDIYLIGTPPKTLIQEITCGEKGMAGVKLVVPESRYNLVTQKLISLRAEDVFVFLSSRCSVEYLRTYVQEYPQILDSASRVHSYLSALPQVLLLAKLHHVGLLPEEYRVRFVNKVKELALTTPDADFLTAENVRGLLTESEIREILAEIRSVLLPDISSKLDDWISNFDRSEDPQSYFQPLLDALEALSEQFDRDKDAQDILSEALEGINQNVQRLLEEYSEIEPSYEDLSPDYEPWDGEDGGRNIFDDVDE